jgi:hypothetical protein
MLTRKGGYLYPRTSGAPGASRQLERDGWAVLPGVLSPADIAELRDAVETVYACVPVDRRNPGLPVEEAEDFRYEMLNRSAVAQRAVAHPAILEVIEPLLGEDCHVIANTCWRNPPRPANQHGGGVWHIDAGPHIPRDPSIPWDDRIPYPVFALGVHVYLQDCPAACGPTGVIPGSHRSGQPPPSDRLQDPDLAFAGRGAVVLEARAGDAALFVSMSGIGACRPVRVTRGGCSCRSIMVGGTSRSACADGRFEPVGRRDDRARDHRPGAYAHRPAPPILLRWLIGHYRSALT